MAVGPAVRALAPPPSDRPFVDGVQALRAVAAVAVVCFHAGGSIGSDTYQGMASIRSLTQGLDAGVDLFFVISGFVIPLPLLLGQGVRPGRFIAGRVLRIYPMAMLTAAVFLAINWVGFSRPPQPATVLSSVFLLPSPAQPVPAVLWTLKQELLFYLMFAPALVWPRIGLGLVALWALASAVVPVSGFLGSWLLHPQNLQFAFGIVAAYLFLHRPPPRARAIALLAVCGPLFAAAAYWARITDANASVSAVLLGACGFGIVLGTASARFRVPAPIMFLGAASYSIYLVHFLAVSAGNRALVGLLPDLPGLAALLLLSVAAVATGGIAYVLLERPMETWRKALLRVRP